MTDTHTLQTQSHRTVAYTQQHITVHCVQVKIHRPPKNLLHRHSLKQLNVQFVNNQAASTEPFAAVPLKPQYTEFLENMITLID